ncbi:hypothetical protein [Pontiella sulfatireligans]|nr:hypothetical protein [Pontiella sulfatireligans]
MQLKIEEVFQRYAEGVGDSFTSFKRRCVDAAFDGGVFSIVKTGA